MVTTILGCSQEQADNTPKAHVNNDNLGSSEDNKANEGNVNNETTDKAASNETDETDDEASTDLFGVLQETEEYTLMDYIDPEDSNYESYELFADQLKHVRGYHYFNRGYSEGFDILNGSSFFILAGYGEALKIKSIEDRNHEFNLVLESVEPGTEFSHNQINVILNKVYKSYNLTMDDGEVLQEYHEINYLSTYEGTYKGLTDDDKIIISDIELSAYSSVFFNQLEEIEIGDTVYFKPDLDAEIIYTIEAKPEE